MCIGDADNDGRENQAVNCVSINGIAKMTVHFASATRTAISGVLPRKERLLENASPATACL